ncbi:hypothetical protein SAMN06297422_12052 [Lachnospiraceae bacterium]|nr:hypothetical protein SAMN06297422_12052 [Lachnospiraceae bacterium]
MRKKKVYKFSDELMAKDTIFSFVFGILALVIIIFSIILSVVLKGNIPDYIGTLLFASLLMGITGVFFAFLGYRDQDGGVLGKRTSVLISFIDIILIVLLYIL